MKVSVITPLHNVEDFVGDTIEHLQRQTLHDIELILVDDGSTDNTYAIAKTYADADSRIRLVHQENKGPSGARNHGLRLAKGQYICFVDSDDILSQDALELMYNAAIEHQAELVTGGTVRFNSERTWFIKTYIDHGILEPGLKHISTHPGLLYAVGPCAKLYKRELIEGVFFPEQIRLGEDQPFALHAYMNANRIYTVDAIVYFYRLREGENMSLTQSAIARPLEVFNDLYEMIAITDRMLANHHKLHVQYLERVMLCDIWPRAKAAILSGKPEVQAATFNSMANWMKTVDTALFNDVLGLYYFPLVGTVYRLPHLHGQAFKAAMHLFGVILSKMRPKAYARLTWTVFRKVLSTIGRLVRKPYNLLLRRGQSFLIRHVLFTIAKMLPATRSVVFASNKSEELTGNLKVIYEQVVSSHPDWKVYSYPRANRSFWQQCAQFYHFGVAKVILLDDYYNQLYGLRGRHNGEVVQLWHAAGAFKKFGLSSEGTGDANPREFELRAHKAYTKVITSSSSIREHYAEAFHVPVQNVLPLGVPRTDMFFDTDRIADTKAAFLNAYPALAGKKVILYAPTFRGSPRQRMRFQLQLDLETMNKALGSEYALILKLHPSVREGVRIPEHLQSFAIDLSDVPDINDLMLISDLLITDYSSVVFEYSLLRRPMVFFAYDLESYLGERGFYYDYETFVPGPIATTTDEVIDAILHQGQDLSRVDAFAAYFFDHRDGKAAQRIIDTFLR